MSTQRFLLTGLLVLVFLTPSAAGSLSPEQPATSIVAAASPTASGSMLIVENAGQWPAAARFQVWNSPLGPGTTWLAQDAIWLAVASGRSQVASSEGFAGPLADLSPANLPPATFHALRLTFPGSNPDVRIEPFGPVDTTISYFIGNDPTQWRPAVLVWSGVRYVDLYPGVDLVLGGQDSAWRFEMAPGAAAEQVRLRVEGAEIVAADGTALHLTLNGETHALSLPAAPSNYQVSGSSPQAKHEVLPVQPLSDAPRSPSPDDNPTHLLYSTFLGGHAADLSQAVAVDEAGNAYVTGTTYSSNFPVTPGAFDPSYKFVDAFVAKLNPTGTALVFATFLDGSSFDYGYGISTDDAGSVYVAGHTGSADFPTTPGALDREFNGPTDIFITKLNPTGSELRYSTFVGGNSVDASSAIAIDGTGNAYITGWTRSADFPTSPAAFDTSYNGGDFDGFLVKLSPAGSDLVYATFLGGDNWDQPHGIALDAAGSAFIGGYTTSRNFPTTPGAFQTSHTGSEDAFIVHINETGSGLTYATFLGGSESDFGLAIAVDHAGSAYITGITQSSDLPTTPDAFDPTFNGWYDAFAARLNPTGSDLVFATFLGGSAYDSGSAIAVREGGDVYVAGSSYSSEFPTTPDAFDTSFNGGDGDAFVVRLNLAGNGLIYATFLGGAAQEEVFGMAVRGTGTTFVTGRTFSADLPTTPGAFQTNHGGSDDAFVAALSMNPVTPNLLAPIEQPLAGAFVSGTVSLRGFAIDRASPTGTGIDMVHIYLDGPYGTGTIIGGATYGLDRPDIAAQYGERFRPSGWELAWDTSGLAPGVHRLYLYAHRTTDNAWSLMEPHLVVVAGGPTRWLPIMLRQR